MDFLIKKCYWLSILLVVVILNGCATTPTNQSTQNLTNNKSINNIHLRHDQAVDKNANKIQVKSVLDAEIFYVPETLDSKKGRLFKRLIQEYLSRQALPEQLTATINIYREEHLAAAKDLMGYLQTYGIDKQYIQIKTIRGGKTKQNIDPREILLKTEYYKVYTPKCPNWHNVSGEQNTNFGCATAVNLAVHISNPRDLIIGRKLAPIPSQPKVRQLELFYQGGQLYANGNQANSGQNNNNNQQNNNSQNNNSQNNNSGGDNSNRVEIFDGVYRIEPYEKSVEE